MCGIAALWGDVDRHLLSSLVERQRHRGPDGKGIYVAPEVGTGLGHCRLAIIDPERGAQPLLHADGSAALVANGMIYNDRDLRARLPDAPFRTDSDSESILHSVRAHGPAAAADLDGMYAFVMLDGDRLVAARDPVGIKPLYWARLGRGLAFASEIKALAGVSDAIEEFPPGSHWDSDSGEVRPHYRIPDRDPEPWALPEALAALRETLEAAVVKRLRSDVPLGALLSGGLDSSIIAALARRHVDELHTFAVGLEGSPDLAGARSAARHLGTIHHELVLSRDEVLAALPEVVHGLESCDVDLVRSAAPCHFVARFASERVKVVLTGEGADELFAGYRYYRDYDDESALHAELVRSIGAMHNVNLQRVDRMTMAHGLEARVPFLDVAMIDLGLSIPIGWKLRRQGGRRIEKWILRKAFEDLLPAEIAWRDKQQFDQGSGMDALLRGTVHSTSDGDAAASSEGERYRDFLASRFADPAPVLNLAGTWREGRI